MLGLSAGERILTTWGTRYQYSTLAMKTCDWCITKASMEAACFVHTCLGGAAVRALNFRSQWSQVWFPARPLLSHLSLVTA